MDPLLERPVSRLVEYLRPRNWLAVLALWTALSTWLLLLGSLVAAETFSSERIFNTTGWVALALGTAALILAVAGITAIRRRGEPAVAILALVLVLSLGFANPIFFYAQLLGE